MTGDASRERVARFDRAQADRGTLESHWEEIAKRALPHYAGSFESRGTPRVEGEKRTDDMVDATAALALPKFASVMESMLVPRNSRWQKIITLDSTLRRNRAVRLYYEQVTDILFRYRYAPQANFASQQFEKYMSLGAFGTGPMFIDALDPKYGKGLRYKTLHLSEIYFLVNHQGIVDTAMRKFDLTARQAAQMFNRPGDTLPEKVAEAARSEKDCDKKFWFVHCVKPRDDFEAGRYDAKGMRYASYYDSVEEKSCVREGGYHVFPYAISRYMTAPGETYGRSPAMLALPAMKTLNEQKKTVLKQGHKTVDPVLLTHDDGVLDTLSLKPGAINPGGVDASGRMLVHALPVGNLAVGDKMMDMEKAVIDDSFLLTLFQILVENKHEMTATEIIERAREKGALLAPTMGRQQTEDLGPMTDRELDVLASQGLLPPRPPILSEAELEYDTVYDSPLSRMQRTEHASGFMRWVDWGLQTAQVTGDPSHMDWVDWDTAFPELGEIHGVQERWVASAETVAAKRQARAEQAQAAQAIEALPGAAGAMKAMAGGG